MRDPSFDWPPPLPIVNDREDNNTNPLPSYRRFPSAANGWRLFLVAVLRFFLDFFFLFFLPSSTQKNDYRDLPNFTPVLAALSGSHKMLCRFLFFFYLVLLCFVDWIRKVLRLFSRRLVSRNVPSNIFDWIKFNIFPKKKWESFFIWATFWMTETLCYLVLLRFRFW